MPAPKNGLWTFSDRQAGGWAPRVDVAGFGGAGNHVLRPLAHIGIQEQTVATAVMLCVADCIESAQGDPATPAKQAISKRVYSYGNRLFCNWTKNGARARFPWGNSNTYSRYFQDYQRFVERPNISAVEAEIHKSEHEHVFIVKLDIQAFFDNVDIDQLISCIRKEHDRFAENESPRPTSSQAFWKIARTALRFSWRAEDHVLAPLFRDRQLPEGLPQGLMSSGFFANAYLLSFDRSIGKAIGARGHGTFRFRIHDYCRYVDDLRIVVSVKLAANAALNEPELAKDVSWWVQKMLKKHTVSSMHPGRYLRINESKTEVERVGVIGGDSHTAAQMRLLQQQISGPFDIQALQQVETGLSGLLDPVNISLSD